VIALKTYYIYFYHHAQRVQAGNTIIKKKTKINSMTENLADVYEEKSGAFESTEHLYAGVLLLSIGLIGLGVAVFTATTNGFEFIGLNKWQHWKLAGTLSGISLPLALSGVIVVMPSRTRRNRLAAIGVSLCSVGILGFFYAFPHRWVGDPTNLSFPVVSIFAVGSFITVWCMFSGIIEFKTRNNPGGTVTMKVTRNGETQYVEVDKDEIDENTGGGIGFLGNQPDGRVKTQTNQNSNGQINTTNEIPADAEYEWPDQD
jgi:hypothetical protein